MQVAVREAKAKLSKFGNIAHKGEVVVVCKNGEPWFDMVPHAKTQRKTTPLNGVMPIISEAEAVEPLKPGDLPGWS
jgi:antitoxin (DNA-binding transcriptional repressor) of toxin-antitoxin stability system